MLGVESLDARQVHYRRISFDLTKIGEDRGGDVDVRRDADPQIGSGRCRGSSPTLHSYEGRDLDAPRLTDILEAIQHAELRNDTSARWVVRWPADPLRPALNSSLYKE